MFQQSIINQSNIHLEFSVGRRCSMLKCKHPTSIQNLTREFAVIDSFVVIRILSKTSSDSLPKTPRLVTTITRLVFFTSSFLTFNKNYFSTLSNWLISTAMKLFLNLSNSKVDCDRFPKKDHRRLR